MTTNIQPLHDRVIVKRIDEGEQVRGGIIIPDTAKEKPQEGEVIAAGLGKYREDGSRQSLDVHGKTGWRYQYETGELGELAARCIDSRNGYVFFNNYKMTADAVRFCKVLNDPDSKISNLPRSKDFGSINS